MYAVLLFNSGIAFDMQMSIVRNQFDFSIILFLLEANRAPFSRHKIDNQTFDFWNE